MGSVCLRLPEGHDAVILLRGPYPPMVRIFSWRIKMIIFTIIGIVAVIFICIYLVNEKMPKTKNFIKKVGDKLISKFKKIDKKTKND